jgi:UDP-N-acetylglucosamine 2-epimerase (non-hydrolysing)
LIGTDPEKICKAARVLLEEGAEYERRSQLKNPYGDGEAAKRIRTILEGLTINGNRLRVYKLLN